MRFGCNDESISQGAVLRNLTNFIMWKEHWTKCMDLKITMLKNKMFFVGTCISFKKSLPTYPLMSGTLMNIFKTVVVSNNKTSLSWIEKSVLSIIDFMSLLLWCQTHWLIIHWRAIRKHETTVISLFIWLCYLKYLNYWILS